MSLRNKLLGIGFAGLTLLSVGCTKSGYPGESKEPAKETPKEVIKYFAGLRMYIESGMAMTSGDFDGDGDLDLIVGAHNGKMIGRETGKLYFFENDGECNFKLRPSNNY